jgi:hypothetical protein
MSTELSGSLAARPLEARATAALVAIAAWTITVPYLGRAIGLVVPVAARVEFVDHVIPGAIVVVAGLYLHRLARRRALADERLALPAAGVSFLAGFWVLVTHLPLLGDAADAQVGWDAAIWHSITGLPLAGVALWCVLMATPKT